MYSEWRESYVTKYASPFAAYVFATVSPQDCDEDYSDGNGGGWIGRYGRRVLVEDSQGFADVARYATTDAAHLAYLDARGVPLEDLTDDGDEVETSSGTLRLRVEPDEIGFDTWSDDCYGRVEYVDDRPRHYVGQYPARPDGFDGNAEKIHVRDGAYWWQPPADIVRGTDVFTRQRRLVRDLLDYGFSSVGLELLKGTDAYGRPIVTNAAWLGGVEPNADADYLAEVVRDLASELGLI